MGDRKPVRYTVVDAFTSNPFKGNPASVCFLDEAAADEEWMQSVATEFNLSVTAFVYPPTFNHPNYPTYRLRWFTPVEEVDLCGHATLATAHLLLADHDMIEFVTRSGFLTAKKVQTVNHYGIASNLESEAAGGFSIELDFPVVPFVECDSSEIPSIPETLKGACMTNIHKTTTSADLIVELTSGKDVADIQPVYAELQKCAGRGVIITGAAPPGSGYDFFTRVFCPKLGVNEDPVTGSVHCALAPYWSKKLGKHNLIAYQASPRGGRLELQLDEDRQRVRIKGEAVTVVQGVILV